MNGKPTAAQGHMPFPGHRSMAEVMGHGILPPAPMAPHRPAYVEREPRNTNFTKPPRMTGFGRVISPDPLDVAVQRAWDRTAGKVD